MKKNIRLIEWNLEILGNLLKQVVASRGSSRSLANFPSSKLNLRIQSDSILDELQEVIELPAFSDNSTIEEPSSLPPLSKEVQEELRGVYFRNSCIVQDKSVSVCFLKYG